MLQDYAADGIDEEESTSPLTTTTTTTMKPSTTTTAKTTTTTTTTTTTQRPHVTARRQTAVPTVHNSDNQDKSDYPAMSAHSSYKWKTLGTRESVEKTRNAMANQRNRVNKSEFLFYFILFFLIKNNSKINFSQAFISNITWKYDFWWKNQIFSLKLKKIIIIL